MIRDILPNPNSPKMTNFGTLSHNHEAAMTVSGDETNSSRTKKSLNLALIAAAVVLAIIIILAL